MRKNTLKNGQFSVNFQENNPKEQNYITVQVTVIQSSSKNLTVKKRHSLSGKIKTGSVRKISTQIYKN